MIDTSYTIDDILESNPVLIALSQPVPSYQSGDGSDVVGAGSVSSGSLYGNTIIQDGYLQSSNYEAGVSGWRLDPTTGEINFGLSVAKLHIPDRDTTASSFHVATDGDAWWGATETNFNANNDNATAYVLKDGTAKFQSVVLSGNVAISGIANNTGTDISLLSYTHDIVFTSTDADTVSWSAGTITMSNGRTFSIDAGNTGNMTVKTLIYLDTVTSLTVLQTTTSPSTAIGSNKILVALAEDSTQNATFQVTSGIGGLSVDEAQVFVANLAAINADMGAITAGTITLPSGGHIKSGQTAYDTGTGFYLGNDGGTSKFSIGKASGDKMTWDGSTLGIVGTVSGIIIASDLSGEVSDGNLNISAQGWQFDGAFSATDADTVAWGSGTLRTAGGGAYSIIAGNTGNMVAITYIYLDIAVSTTALQSTITAATAVGSGKILVAVAENKTDEAFFQVFGGKGGVLLSGDSFAANSVVANNINVANLAAINADLGAITAGTIVLPATGFIRSGQTAYDTGTGWYIGNDGGTPKLSIGDGVTKRLTWDGTDLTISGLLNSVIGELLVGGEWYRISIPWLSSVWSDPGSQVTTFGYFNGVIDLDGSASDAVYLTNALHYSVPTFAKSAIFTTAVTFSASDSSQTHGVVFGFAATPNTTLQNLGQDTVTNGSGKDGAVFFLDADGSLFARTANEGVETDVEITGITITNSNVYRIVWDAGTEVRFYVNSILEATISTNLPTSTGAMGIGFGKGSTTTNYNISSVSNVDIFLEN